MQFDEERNQYLNQSVQVTAGIKTFTFLSFEDQQHLSTRPIEPFEEQMNQQ